MFWNRGKKPHTKPQSPRNLNPLKGSRCNPSTSSWGKNKSKQLEKKIDRSITLQHGSSTLQFFPRVNQLQTSIQLQDEILRHTWHVEPWIIFLIYLKKYTGSNFVIIFFYVRVRDKMGVRLKMNGLLIWRWMGEEEWWFGWVISSLFFIGWILLN